MAVGAAERRAREQAAGQAWEAMYGLVFEREGQRRFHRVCDDTGLSPGVVKALLRLSPDQPVAMRDLADHFGCDPSYVTTLVDGLETAGLAERQAHPSDRRVRMVVLSPSGTSVLAQVRKVLGEPPTSFAALDTGELLELRDLLGKVAAWHEQSVSAR